MRYFKMAWHVYWMRRWKAQQTQHEVGVTVSRVEQDYHYGEWLKIVKDLAADRSQEKPEPTKSQSFKGRA